MESYFTFRYPIKVKNPFSQSTWYQETSIIFFFCNVRHLSKGQLIISICFEVKKSVAGVQQLYSNKFSSALLERLSRKKQKSYTKTGFDIYLAKRNKIVHFKIVSICLKIDLLNHASVELLLFKNYSLEQFLSHDFVKN